MRTQEHIDSAVVTRPQTDSSSRIYSMQTCWGKQSPDVVAQYISCYTANGDIILDPYSYSGVTVCEAVRLGRKVIAISQSPLASFLTKATLTPVSLPRLQWAFEDVERACQGVEDASQMFSAILQTINAVQEDTVRDVMKLALIAALDECNREEVDPWHAFSRTFARVYAGKVESNALLPHVVFASDYADLQSGRANVLLIEGTCDESLRDLPQKAVDYILTDLSGENAVQNTPLAALCGVWLGMASGNAQEKDCPRAFTEIGRVLKNNGYAHVMFSESNSNYMHDTMGRMNEAQLRLERVVYQPPTNTDSSGMYIVRSQASSTPDSATPSTEDLSKRIATLTQKALEIRGGEAPVRAIQHAVYQQLTHDDLLAFVQQPAKDLLRSSIEQFARIHGDHVKLTQQPETSDASQLRHDVREAMLDAKSLLAGEDDVHTRVLQRILHRFQDSGVTLEDVRAISADITDSEVSSHHRDRMVRFVSRLQKFGVLLGYACEADGDANIVRWEKLGKIAVAFHLRNDDIAVRLALPGEPQTESTWGTIAYLDLEAVMWNWCVANAPAGDDLNCDLHPPETDVQSPRVLPMGDTQCRGLTVLSNNKVCEDHYLMRLKLPARSMSPLPGQFFHVICDPTDVKHQDFPLTLRRPFSIHGVAYDDFQQCLLARSEDFPQEFREIIQRHPSEISFLYKIVGRGTKYLTEIAAGETLDIIAPCGNGFNIGTESTAVLVAGGIGAAPLAALAEHLRYLEVKVHMYLGALTGEYLAPALCRPDQVSPSGSDACDCYQHLITDELMTMGASAVQICTDDGSEGLKGFATDLLAQHLADGTLPTQDICVYACGPRGMLKAVANITNQFSVKCQVLMEERMACGIGACAACTCEVETPNGTERKRVCKDGPVFDARVIRW